jgi:hypothetical protein
VSDGAAGLSVFKPSPFEAEIVIAKFKKCKLTCSVKISLEVIQTGGEEMLWSEIHKLIMFEVRMNCLITMKEAIIIVIYKKGNETD